MQNRGAVVLLATNSMITKGAASYCFAGDATFKTLENDVSTVRVVMSTEESFRPFRFSDKVSYYLYNVVA